MCPYSLFSVFSSNPTLDVMTVISSTKDAHTCSPREKKGPLSGQPSATILSYLYTPPSWAPGTEGYQPCWALVKPAPPLKLITARGMNWPFQPTSCCPARAYLQLEGRKSWTWLKAFLYSLFPWYPISHQGSWILRNPVMKQQADKLKNKTRCGAEKVFWTFVSRFGPVHVLGLFNPTPTPKKSNISSASD